MLLTNMKPEVSSELLLLTGLLLPKSDDSPVGGYRLILEGRYDGLCCLDGQRSHLHTIFFLQITIRLLFSICKHPSISFFRLLFLQITYFFLLASFPDDSFQVVLITSD